MVCLEKLREFLSVLSITSVYEGTNEYANDLIENIIEKLTELRLFLEEEEDLMLSNEEELLATILEEAEDDSDDSIC